MSLSYFPKFRHPSQLCTVPNLRAVLTAFIISIASSQWALATTLVSMDIDTVTQKAELVFEGQVLELNSQQDGTGVIHTYVTFSVIDVIKGDYDARTIELKFLGGAINGRMVAVTGLTLPKQDEQGIYFVESTTQSLVNPLLGWSQGHYLITTDSDGVRRVSSTDSKPINQVQSVAAMPRSIRRPRLTIEGKTDVATGVVTGSSAQLMDQALTVDQFKLRIRQLIEN